MQVSIDSYVCSESKGSSSLGSGSNVVTSHVAVGPSASSALYNVS